MESYRVDVHMTQHEMSQLVYSLLHIHDIHALMYIYITYMPCRPLYKCTPLPACPIVGDGIYDAPGALIPVQYGEFGVAWPHSPLPKCP